MGGGAVANGSAFGRRERGRNVKLMGARGPEGHRDEGFKSLADDGKKQIGSGVVAIFGVTGDGKAA